MIQLQQKTDAEALNALKQDFEYKFQSGDTVEEFADGTWRLATDLFHDFGAGIFQMGYRATISARISGTASQKHFNAVTVLKQSAFGVVANISTDPGFEGTRTSQSKGGYVVDDGRSMYTTHNWYDDNVIITSPIRLSLHFSKSELFAGTSIGVSVKGDASGSYGGVELHPSQFFYRKIGDL